MDDHTTSGAPTPDRIPSLPRRVAAGLIDLTIVLSATAAAAIAASTRVPANRQPDGSIAIADVDRRLLEGMNGPLGRGHLLGDTLWAYSTTDVAVIVAVAVVTGIVVGSLLPRLADGRSPGKMLFRMCVVAADGEPAGIVRHLLRTLFSAIDLMPVVVPGLTGFAFAASNPNRRRVGDRVAGTIVVNRQSGDDMISTADALASPVRTVVTEPARTGPTRTGPTVTGVAGTGPARTTFVPTIRSATLVDHAPARPDTFLNRRPKPPDLDVDRVPKPHRAPVRADTTPAGRDDGVPEPQPIGDTVDMNERHSASEPSPAASTATPVPVEERSNNPYPKPVRRSRDITEETKLPDFDSLTLPESSLSDMPLTNNALFEALGLTPPGSAPVDAHPDPQTDEAMPAESFREAGDPPDVAPVVDERRKPTPLARRTRRSNTAEVPGARSERAVAPVTAPIATVRHGSRPAPDKRAPIWSEDWDAWIYWDTTLKAWFRHDMEARTWVPMEDT